MPSCSAAEQGLQILHDVRPFLSTPAISIAHNAAPRFGHTNNITQLIYGSPEEGEDYLRGLVAGSIAVVILFVAWVILLLYFKFRGPQQYGWLSGSRNPLPPNPNFLSGHEEGSTGENTADDAIDLGEMPSVATMGDDQPETAAATHDPADEGADDDSWNPNPILKANAYDDENWNKRYERLRTQDRRMKRCVIISAAAIIICSIFMAAKGYVGLCIESVPRWALEAESTYEPNLH